jgi:hypothetical protein
MTIFVKLIHTYVTGTVENLRYFCHLKKTAEIGENSPNLVTLAASFQS